LANLAQRVHSQISTLPGVVSASVSSGGVLDGGAAGSRSENLQFEGQPSRPGLITHSLAVSPGFFSTVGMQVIRGRGLEPRDADRSAPVAVISESMAAFFFPGVDPVGRRFGPAGERGYPIEIVGVVKDAKAGTPRDQRAAWYFPYQQNARFLRLNWCIAVRTAGSPMSAAPGVQQALREIEPNLAILRVNTVESQLDHILARERMITTLSSLLAILAVLLSCLGLYGLISLRVVRRTSEIGIRLAPGATPGSVLRLVIGESMLLVLGGIIAGLPLAMALKRFLATWLFGVDGADPTILVATAGLMLVVAISAAFVPALRVNRIDPATVLRNE
jgi:predicted permease